ncbi:DUF5590 domain-containing protein [Saccharibacillus deserti]|uniref:DUF5590 domain-containing protein n=1 Tax=Saccharibacillus deserti TaxID=1634444 RepID=UPI0015539C96
MSKRTKIILLAVLVLLILLSGAYLYYTLSMKERTNERSEAVALAVSKAQLTETGRADKWVWGEDSIFWVVQGSTAAGEQQYVWLQYTQEGKPAEGKSAVRIMPAAGTISREDMWNRLETELPDADLIRMLPGFYNKQYVWQIFYEQAGERYYRFYSLTDGRAIDEPFLLPGW